MRFAVDEPAQTSSHARRAASNSAGELDPGLVGADQSAVQVGIGRGSRLGTRGRMSRAVGSTSSSCSVAEGLEVWHLVRSDGTA